MPYITDRKRAMGLGSAKTGTEHHWRMHVTSVALTILAPLFVFTFGRILGASHEEVVAYYARPFPAIVTALTLVVALVHFREGAQVVLEDYVHGFARRSGIVVLVCLCYGAMAVGLFALVRLAL